MNEDIYIIWKESFQKASNNATRNWQTTYAVLKLPEVINGFYDTMTVQDYPIRGKRALLRIKRRRWIDRTTGRSFGNDYELVAKGTRHSVEFAAFLKEFLGGIPDYGPLA